MIDIKLLKDDPKRVKAELTARGQTLQLEGKALGFDEFLKLDADRRRLQQELDTLRQEQKATRNPDAGKKLKAAIQSKETDFGQAEAQFHELYLQLPNFHHDSVSVGEDESGNKVVKTVGDKQIPDQVRNDGWAKPHYEIPAIKPLIDFARGAKLSGSRFWYLKGDLVYLEFALIRYTLDFYSAKGFLPMRPPSIVNHHAMEGTGFFPADENMIYVVEGETDDPNKPKQYLAGTAEVPLASYHAGETLSIEDLPIKYIGFAPAYRREAGSYGQDTKGILRGHEFDKLELFIFADPERSWSIHEQLQSDAEEFWSSLGIPFQVLNMCTGDIGAPNAKKYDLEAWMPGEGKYREVASNSNDTDFQARRLKIKTGEGDFVHTLNNTAAAIGRTIIAIVENYQDKDGNVDMPKVLHNYLPFKKITTKKEG